MYPTFFFPFTIFSMYVYEDSLSFFFYPTSFCTGINTKTEKKNLEIRKGRQEHSKRTPTFFIYEHLQRFFIFLFLFYCFLYSDKYKNKTKKSKLKREDRSIRNVLLCNRPFFLHYHFSRNIYADSLSFFSIPLLLFRD